MKLCPTEVLAGAMALLCFNASAGAAAEFVSNVGAVSFSSPLEQIQAPGDFDFLGGYQGPIYLCDCDSLTLDFSPYIQTFDFYLKPNSLALADIAFDYRLVGGSSYHFPSTLSGVEDARLIDFIAGSGAIASLRISSADLLGEGFAIGELNATIPTESVPEPSSAIATLAITALLISLKKICH